VNGDGFSDVIIGAPNYNDGDPNNGAAFLWLGGAGGLGPNGSPANIDWHATGLQSGELFGAAVGTAGDVNGDGYADVIVGAYAYNNGLAGDAGAAFVYHGSVAGLALAPTWTALGQRTGDNFGYSVGTAGDVNGDGYSDVIVGAYSWDNGLAPLDVGMAFLYRGSSTGLEADAVWFEEGLQAGEHRGSSVGTAGDVDGDGYADVIVGANGGGTALEGTAFRYRGWAGGLVVVPNWTAEMDQGGARFGDFVGTAGDVNGDGFSDVIIGAPDYDDGDPSNGAAFLWLGGAGGLGPDGSPANVDWYVTGIQQGELLGHGVGTAGDVNGDGFSDVIVGAYSFNSGVAADAGKAFVYHGSAAGLMASSSWNVDSDQADANLGFSVGTAGDVDGDGYSDVIVGAPGFDAGENAEGRVFVYHGSPAGLATTAAWTAERNQPFSGFGESVRTAGDVNLDGYSDVIVGASAFDSGQEDEGKAFVYLGSPAGLQAAAAWTAESDQAFANFGYSVGTAGDVNADGCSDVIVGAPNFSGDLNHEGKAYVYHGAPLGLATAAAWTAEGNLASAGFGNAVGTAGDVNRDGISDVIVGASNFNGGQPGEGRASVYLGSTTGLRATAIWSAEGNQDNAYFGSSVGTAGDVNGDGYSDVIVGAPYFTNGESEEGKAFVYRGGGIGVLVEIWTTEGNLANAHFGRSVGTAGDVNGDGFSDVVVGAERYSAPEFQEGRAFVYHGSAAGLSIGSGWEADANQDSAFFGFSVGTAGDVNGDGFSDVIVGAFGFENMAAETSEGMASVFYGNGGDGLDRVPRQARTDGSAPIAILGTTDSVESFRLRLLGRTAAGRGRVRMEYEVKQWWAPFDGSAIVRTPLVDTGAPGARGSVLNSLDASVAGLPFIGQPYKWRVRLSSPDPFFPRSPWFSLPGNARTETDLRVDHNIDADGDGVSQRFGDCDDLNPFVWAAPKVVDGLTVAEIAGGYRVAWTSQAESAGPSTHYDVFSGLISLLRPGGDFSTGACAANNLAAPSFDDLGPDPAAGDAYYFIVRGQNVCGTGTYGTAQRDAGAALSAAACP